MGIRIMQGNHTTAAEQVALLGEPGMTLGEMVRATLVDCIIRGLFKEGDRLYPERISEMFGVSITPVREALIQLASEGFIQNIQRRGFHVMLPDPVQVREIWQVRMGLEQLAGDLAILRLQDGDLADADLVQLDRLQDEQELEGIDHAVKLELNGRLHATIVALSGNQLLANLHQGLRSRVLGGLVQLGSERWRERLASESREHRAIIAAIKARDREACREAIRAHVMRSLGDALEDLRLRKT